MEPSTPGRRRAFRLIEKVCKPTAQPCNQRLNRKAGWACYNAAMSETNLSSYLLAPEIDWTAEKTACFEAIYQDALRQGSGQPVDYHAPYPKYEFICYLVAFKGLLVHGSSDPEIETFEPRPQTDYFGRFTRAVFATPDAIWPMYFAIIDRPRYRGTLQNDCTNLRGEAGVERRCYQFSISSANKGARPFTTGTLYLLPPDTFSPVLDEAGQPVMEWLSPEPVAPLAKIRVAPEDFPFLDAIRVHEDKFTELGELVFTRFQQAEELPLGYVFHYPWDRHLAVQLMDWAAEVQMIVPSASVVMELAANHSTMRLRLEDTPEFKHMLTRQMGYFQKLARGEL